MLFLNAVNIGKKKGAEKFFISSVPSEETIAFYQMFGARDAEEIIEDFVDTPNDRYMEFSL